MSIGRFTRVSRRTAGMVLACVVAPILMAGLMGGCATKERTGTYSFNVSMDEERLRAQHGGLPSVEVDLVGVAESVDMDSLVATSVEDYFRPGSSVRREFQDQKLATTRRFSERDSADKRLASPNQGTPEDREIWNAWTQKQATHVVILASMSLPPDIQPGSAQDRRKLVLPLSTQRWNDGQIIEIEIRSTGLHLKSGMKPVKN